MCACDHVSSLTLRTLRPYAALSVASRNTGIPRRIPRPSARCFFLPFESTVRPRDVACTSPETRGIVYSKRIEASRPLSFSSSTRAMSGHVASDTFHRDTTTDQTAWLSFFCFFLFMCVDGTRDVRSPSSTNCVGSGLGILFSSSHTHTIH